MGIIGIVVLILATFWWFDWHARFVFVALAYPRRNGHGKSFNRAHRHYKKNWSFFQRIFWIPVFRETYALRYRFLAYLSYGHMFLASISSIAFIFNFYGILSSEFCKGVLIVYLIYMFIRMIYDLKVR